MVMQLSLCTSQICLIKNDLSARNVFKETFASMLIIKSVVCACVWCVCVCRSVFLSIPRNVSDFNIHRTLRRSRMTDRLSVFLVMSSPSMKLAVDPRKLQSAAFSSQWYISHINNIWSQGVSKYSVEEVKPAAREASRETGRFEQKSFCQLWKLWRAPDAAGKREDVRKWMTRCLFLKEKKNKKTVRVRSDESLLPCKSDICKISCRYVSWSDTSQNRTERVYRWWC